MFCYYILYQIYQVVWEEKIIMLFCLKYFQYRWPSCILNVAEFYYIETLCVSENVEFYNHGNCISEKLFESVVSDG